MNNFCPEITDLDSASSAARQRAWAALFICCADIVVGGLAMLGESPIAGVDPSIVLDGLVFGAIAIGIWMRLRTAAVVGLLWFMLASAIQALSLRGPWIAVMQFLLLLMFVS